MQFDKGASLSLSTAILRLNLYWIISADALTWTLIAYDMEKLCITVNVNFIILYFYLSTRMEPDLD